MAYVQDLVEYSPESVARVSMGNMNIRIYYLMGIASISYRENSSSCVRIVSGRRLVGVKLVTCWIVRRLEQDVARSRHDAWRSARDTVSCLDKDE